VTNGAATAMEIAGAVGKTARGINKRAKKEGWAFENGNGRGGAHKLYLIKGLPGDVQKKMIENTDHISSDMIPTLSPGAALAAYAKSNEVLEWALADSHTAQTTWADGAAISEAVLTDPRVRRIAGIVQDALDVPRGWKKSKWIDAVAIKHGTTRPTIYKWIKKYKKEGLTGLQHTKSNKGKPKKWTPEAIDWWIGLCLKQEHRKIAKDALYEILTVEAQKRGWSIGVYESALGWYNKKVTPQLLALQRGGYRALDNTLPPVLRSYADLSPFEILVGDQHRFDFWVIDDDTGQLFRPEGFFWQDLRTRLFYGGAVDKKYDSQLIGLALRIGCRLFGAFNAIYTDHGKPELSRYIMGIMAAVKSLGMSVERTTDADVDITKDPEAVNPCMILPGTHKKAIVRNAKAKMIEGTFNVLEGILRDHFKVPGSVKRLAASGEEQDVDQKEIERLAKSGKLLTFTEFAVTMYQAMDYYNKVKTHRGALKEWAWKPKPKSVTPEDCLRACFVSGWRPRWLSPEDVDMVFLARADRGGRMVDRGRISLNNQLYEHDALERLHKTRVDVRYDCMDPDWVLCFKDGEFICRAVPVEYSSMKDQDLAGKKIAEKAVRRRASLKTYRDLTTNIPDFLNVSQVPMDERPEAVLGTPKQRQKIMESRAPVQTEDELAADVAMIENYRHRNKPVFSSEVDRYQWAADQGSKVSDEDRVFMKEYEARMDIDTREYWETYKESIAI
jgi:putative transposase